MAYYGRNPTKRNDDDHMTRMTEALSRHRVPRRSAARAAVACLLLSVALSCHGRGGIETPAQRRPDVILISIDTLRADHMSVYGYERLTTPRLEEIAQHAVVFDRLYYSGGGTLPSHLTMMTSLNPITHGITPENGLVLPAQRTTLAERLAEAGYATGGFVDGGWVSAKFGFAQGFDVYDDSGGHFAASLPKAQVWLEEHTGEPVFLFLHTYDVHSTTSGLPYSCPGDFTFRYADPATVDFDGCRDGRCASDLLASVNQRVRIGEATLTELLSARELEFITALYDGCINYVDARLADFFGLLRQLGRFESSVIIVTSDHGEEFGEHGMMIHDQGGYEEFARIPLIIRLPDAREGGRRIDHLAATVDIAPTILDILDLPALEDGQGYSLVPTIFDDVPVRSDVHMYGVLMADGMKFFSGRHRLFDLREDPTESVNLYEARPDLVGNLAAVIERRIAADKSAFAAFIDAMESPMNGVTITPEELARLRALGYIR